ncbi:conserved hypothetical protein [Xenorhabdus nematophila F1]|uniref:Uncharacterized protein n=1 Tax=Xenorhabdus nematophila (strain ATCC 19061 / DSM 3370 / CCUG 14189 / LMG 1036 / NCIMB 9965 / AN6) TaxID=406817 RepID=D3VBQ7_XENNA|nr:hypothetical protein XNC1_3865 [Xenorhabdus nematophila ATCC 19061]CCW31950.1 conserved hypothetical protein [Xenorhabdus nematophila F1]CEK24713.1 hypothetical protein XNC2_3719 [Xenorhabdus nematophila AN6/1]
MKSEHFSIMGVAAYKYSKWRQKAHYYQQELVLHVVTLPPLIIAWKCEKHAPLSAPRHIAWHNFFSRALCL